MEERKSLRRTPRQHLFRRWSSHETRLDERIRGGLCTCCPTITATDPRDQRNALSGMRHGNRKLLRTFRDLLPSSSEIPSRHLHLYLRLHSERGQRLRTSIPSRTHGHPSIVAFAELELLAREIKISNTVDNRLCRVEGRAIAGEGGCPLCLHNPRRTDEWRQVHIRLVVNFPAEQQQRNDQ